MSKLKKAELAKTTYQGSAESARFQPGTAKSNAKSLAGKKNQLIQDERVKEEELLREQAANNLELKARQTAQSSELNVVNTVNKNNLARKLQNEKNDLALSNLHAKSKLNLEGLHLRAQSGLDIAGLQAQHQVAASRTKLIGDIAQLSLSFAGDVLEYKQAQAKIDNENAEIDSFLDLIDLGDTSNISDAVKTEDANYRAEIVTTQSAINKVTDNPNVQNALGQDMQSDIQQIQAKRISAGQAAINLPGDLSSYMSGNTQLVDSKGNSFTPLTVQNNEQIQLAIRAGISRWAREAGVSGMPRSQLLSVIIPTARAAMQQQSATLNAHVNRNRTAASLLNAKDSATVALSAPNRDVGSIFQTLTAEYAATRKYSGSRTLAGDQAVKDIIAHAVATKDKPLLDDLKDTSKVAGNSGLKLGKLYEAEIEEASLKIASGIVQQANLVDKQVQIQINEIQLERLEGLSDPNATELEQRAISQHAIEKLEALGTYEGMQAAIKLRNAEGGTAYNPYTFGQMQEAQNNGYRYTNEELKEAVSNGLPVAKAKMLGYDPDSTGSFDEQAADALNKYNIGDSVEGNASTLVDIALEGVGDPDKQKLAKDGEGKGVQADLERRLWKRVYDWERGQIAEGREPNETDIRNQLNQEYLVLEEEMRTLAGKLKPTQGNRLINLYQQGGSEFPGNNSVQFTLKSPRTGAAVRDYSTMELSELQQLGSGSNKSLDLILTKQEVINNQKIRLEGGNYSKAIEDKAAAVGTNAETLLRMQSMAHNMPIISEYVASTGGANPTIDGLRVAIIGKESGGSSNVVNPDTGAIGLGQVLPSNVPSWTRNALGKSLTPRQFRNNPEAQLKTINYQLNKIYQDQLAAGYKGDIAIRRVASIWYSGNGSLYNSDKAQYSGGNQYPSIRSYTLNILKRVRQNPTGN